MPRCIACLAALAIASLAASCGGGEESYTSRTEAICADLLEQVRALEFVAEAEYTKAGEGDSAAIAKLEDVFSEYVPIMETGLEDLRTLSPPEEDAQAAEEFLSSFERLVAYGRDDLAALRARTLEVLSRRMPERHTLVVEVTLAAARAGVTCAPPHAPPH